MKKYLILFLSAFILTFGVSALNVSATATSTTVATQSMTVSQLVELLISVGAIAPDKAGAARAVAVTLSQASPVVIATSTSYIQVLSPNGGQSWAIDLDVAQAITWGSAGLSQVRIALVSTAKKNNVCELMTSPVASKNGNNTFNVKFKTAQCHNLITGTSTPLTDGTYKVRVYYTDIFGNTIKDESDATFKITPKPIPSLKVTYPNGGETLIRNHDYEAKYKLTNVVNVDNNLIYLELLDNNGNVVFNSHKTKRTDGVYSLELPSSLSAGAYKIKLQATESADDVVIEDTSDNFFWISTSL